LVRHVRVALRVCLSSAMQPIEGNMHVTKSLGSHDMIIGRCILKFLQIDLRFSNEVIA